jgi:hypothetical protein
MSVSFVKKKASAKQAGTQTLVVAVVEFEGGKGLG